jgi:hypothetical protein
MTTQPTRVGNTMAGKAAWSLADDENGNDDGMAPHSYDRDMAPEDASGHVELKPGSVDAGGPEDALAHRESDDYEAPAAPRDNPRWRPHPHRADPLPADLHEILTTINSPDKAPRDVSGRATGGTAPSGGAH